MGERFFTTKAPGHGTGLGLATIRDLLREIGGHLSIDGGAGQGASVALNIPVCGDLSRPERVPAAAGATVLLVEDEDMLRGLFARALTQAGWRVLQADSAEAALDALEPPPVDLAALVTDLALPGMTGRQLVERVRAMPGWADLPVVFASGWPDAELQHGRPADSITAMLAKPFDPRDLTTLLAAMTTPAHGIQPVARQKMS
jgi:CheY-like chemotaxis protein